MCCCCFLSLRLNLNMVITLRCSLLCIVQILFSIWKERVRFASSDILVNGCYLWLSLLHCANSFVSRFLLLFECVKSRCAYNAIIDACQWTINIWVFWRRNFCRHFYANVKRNSMIERNKWIWMKIRRFSWNSRRQKKVKRFLIG